MVSAFFMAFTKFSGVDHYTGLSTDTKPTSGVRLGSTFVEEDTGHKYQYGATGWFFVGIAIISDNNNPVDVQHPLPADGDRVYAKDIWAEQSNLNNFSGDITDLFDNLHSILLDNSANNPKEIFIHFNSTTPTTVIALGAFSGDFSNVKISALVSGPIEMVLFDGSPDNTKLTSLQVDLPSLGFNALRIQFHTDDAVTLSNLFIAKARAVVSRIQGQKPNGDFVEFQATAGGNFKISVEEYDEAVDPIRRDMEGGGKISVGITAVEATFTATPTHAIIITADPLNTGILYIGKSDVTNLGANALTFLEAGEDVTIDYDDVDNAVYVVSDAAAQNFFKGALI